MPQTTPLYAPTAWDSAALVRRAPSLESHGMADLLSLMGGDGCRACGPEIHPLVLRHVPAGSTLFHEGSDAEAIYFVAGGTLKTLRTDEEGYEQVLSFAGRGEVLGFDAVCLGQHPTAAIALEDASVYAVLVPDVFTLGQRLPELDRVLHLAVSRELTTRAEIADVMAAVSAEVRLARFLVHLCDRRCARGESPAWMYLCMNRRDIASHLGVAHETVSRAFTALASWHYLRVDNRHVEILDMAGLRAFARSTRARVDDSAPVTAHGRRPPPMSHGHLQGRVYAA